ncbi:glycine--tRNA ligase subunit beta [Escherichia coli]
MTNMVGEFTDTQGVMGMHYARHDGEDEAVAVALNQQYQPRFAGDDLPSPGGLRHRAGRQVGHPGRYLRYWHASEGRQRSVALRRAAIGALRIMIEKHLNLDLTLNC